MAPTLAYVSIVNFQTGLIMISGSGFTGTTAVDIESVAATSFTVISDTAILADSAVPLALGAMDITVVTGSGSATAGVTVQVGGGQGGSGGSGGSGSLNMSATPTALYAALWDTDLNLSANNFIAGCNSTVTAGATTTLTVASAAVQFFTGSTTQNVVLPATGVPAGFEIQIINLSTGSVTVKAFNGSVLLTLAGSSAAPYSSATFVAEVATPTAPSNWIYTQPLQASALSGVGTALLKGNGAGGFSAASSTADYVPWSSGTGGILPATSGQHLATQGGNTLDDGSGNVVIKGGTLDGVTIGGTTPAPSIATNILNGPAALSVSSVGAWLNLSAIMTGTTTSHTASVGYLNIADKVINNSGSTFTPFSVLDYVVSPATGSRTAIWGQTVVASVGTAPGPGQGYIGVSGSANTSINLGGTSGNPVGGLWGGWFTASLGGGSYHNSISGIEVDVCSKSSSLQAKKGIRIVLGINGNDDSARGILDDTALQVVQMIGNTTGWGTGIKFGTDQSPVASDISAAWPFTNTSTMFGTSAVGNGLPANIGHDYRNITFTTAAFLAGAAPIGLSTMASAPSAMTGIGQHYVASDGSSHYLNPGGVDTQLGPNLVPATNNTYNLGSGSKYWASAYIANLNVLSTFPGAASTATAAGTTTLNVNSIQVQVFTGSTTQTVLLPTTSVPVGMPYLIINQSSGAVTVQSSGGNTIAVLAGNTQGLFTAQKATPTAQNDWAGVVYTRGKALTVDNSLELAGTDGTKMTFPGSSDTVATLAAAQALTHKDLTDATNTFPTLNQNTTGNAATATKLATARNINGVPFDGSAAVEVNEGFAPSDYGYKWWAYDPVKASGSTNSLTAGQTYGTLIVVRASTTINNVVLVIGTAGSGLTSGQNFAGLFDSSGNLLSATADQSTNWQSSGKKVMALTSAQAVSPGLYYVGWFANGTTPPKFNYDNSTNAGCAAAGSIASSPRSIVDTTNTGLTTAFHSPVALTTASPIYWAGVS